MHFIDALALILLLLSATAIVLGQAALSRADDFEASYWLVAGIAGLAAAVQMTRPGKA
jgi:purine nucleoside permease